MNNNFTLLPTVLCIVATCQHVLVTTSSTNRRYLQDVANNENVDLNVGRNGVEAAAAKGKNSKKKKGAAAANVAENGDVAAARRGKKSNGVAEAAKPGKLSNNDNSGNLEEIRKCRLICHLTSVQGDPSGRLEFSKDLVLPSSLGNRAVGSQSSRPPANRTPPNLR